MTRENDLIKQKTSEQGSSQQQQTTDEQEIDSALEHLSSEPGISQQQRTKDSITDESTAAATVEASQIFKAFGMHGRDCRVCMEAIIGHHRTEDANGTKLFPPTELCGIGSECAALLLTRVFRGNALFHHLHRVSVSVEDYVPKTYGWSTPLVELLVEYRVELRTATCRVCGESAFRAAEAHAGTRMHLTAWIPKLRCECCFLEDINGVRPPSIAKYEPRLITFAGATSAETS